MKKKLSFGTKKCFCSTNVIQMTFIMSFILLFIKFLSTEVCAGTFLTNRCTDLCNIPPLKLVETSHRGIFECIHVDAFKMLHSVLHEQVVFLFMNVLILPNCL